jgi:hypothetical protein
MIRLNHYNTLPSNPIPIPSKSSPLKISSDPISTPSDIPSTPMSSPQPIKRGRPSKKSLINASDISVLPIGTP